MMFLSFCDANGVKLIIYWISDVKFEQKETGITHLKFV